MARTIATNMSSRFDQRRRRLVWAVTAGAMLAVPIAGPASGQCIPPPAGLISWWPGEGDASDIEGANDGVSINGASFAAGEVGQAFSFDGINDQIDIPDSPSLRAGTQFTIEAWFNTIDHTVDQCIVMYGWSPPQGKNNLLRLRNGFLHFSVRGPAGGSATQLSGVSPVQSGTWHHGAFTFDGITGRLYLDGVLENAMPLVMNLDENSRVLIGRYQNPLFFNYAFPFHGLIDEVEIFDRALLPSEILAIFNATSCGKCKGPLLLDDLIDSVNDLGLSVGDRTPLLAMLGNAQGLLQDGPPASDGAAISLLGVFIIQVATLPISQDEIDALIAAAEAIIAALECQ